MADNKLLTEIASGLELRHQETIDKSAPKIEGDVQLKKLDRAGLLTEIKSDHQLNHAETVDKSAPVIDSSTHVKTVDRKGFLNEVAKAASEKSQ